MITEVAFLGLGNMGMPMALNLLRNGIKVFGYNRSPKDFTTFLEEGGILLNHPQEAFEKAPVAFTMVTNDEAVESLSGEMLKGAKTGGIHVSMSTISPSLSQTLAKECKEKGMKFISAPVFGRPDAAKASKLWICMSGDREAKTRIEPLLHYLGQKVDDFGEDVGTANLVKVIGNFMVFSTIELLTESYSCGEKNGIDTHKLNDFFTLSLFNCPVFKIYGAFIANKTFTPQNFRLSIGQKDLNIFIKATEGLDLPFRDVLKHRIEHAIEVSGDTLDWSSVALD